ncbi:MAG: hypothetical protein KJN76_07795 [Eudoraea sp.]|nr:hypothetical protein [Eudoraea sp.]
MKTQEFLELLEQNQHKSLIFEYRPGKLVGANYHITEVKNIRIDAVDCGAGTDSWKETVIQLWESPKERDKIEYMSAFKALGILNKVHKIRPMELGAEVKFEYSNSHFHTAQLFVNEVEVEDRRLLIRMGVEQTDCKAKETCGPAVEIAVKAEACCEPGSGCC